MNTPSERLVAGLDIGSAKTTAIIAEVVGDLPKHPTIKVLDYVHKFVWDNATVKVN